MTKPKDDDKELRGFLRMLRAAPDDMREHFLRMIEKCDPPARVRARMDSMGVSPEELRDFMRKQFPGMEALSRIERSAIQNPKLLAARAKVEAILEEYDLAGIIVLHSPGVAEMLVELSPSYSRLAMVETEGGGCAMHLRSKLEDYGGDKEAQRRDLAATANMTSMFAELTASIAAQLEQMNDVVQHFTGAEHGDMEKLPANDSPPEGTTLQ